jgi:cytochrome c553
MYVHKNMKALGLGSIAAGLSLLAISACGTAAEDKGDCVSNEQFFQEEIYVKTLASKCMTCHTSDGAAKDSSFILRGSEWGPDYLEQNLEIFSQMARLEYDGEPWILAKPTQAVEHGGLEQFKAGSDEYKAFSDMIARVGEPVVCDETNVAEEFFDGVELLDEVATLRKASLALVGRLPTIEEEQQVRDGGFEALDLVLDDMMNDEVFYDRIVEIYNDHFLTDRYYPDTRATDLLGGLTTGDDADTPIYPNMFWYENLPEEEMLQAEEFANEGLARQSLELIVHVVRNELPFTEILTADYTMVNAFSAKSYGVEANFETGAYDEFVPAKIPGIPHAGVLTNTIFMNRFPTTATNVNRHRARMVYEMFLATDVLRLGERPLVDATGGLPDNPTRNAAVCVSCHSLIDPMAGTMQNWNDLGVYDPPEVWNPEMVPPGFGDAVMPVSEEPRAEQWLAQQLVADPRFAIAPVHILFTGLSGQEPLREPSDVNDEHYLAKIRAFDVQSKVFQGIADTFVEDGYNLKSVVKEIIKSPYYRAANATGLTPEREAELGEVGTGRLLTPEQLHRKVEAITGQPWRQQDGNDFLLSENEYLIFYGGINSDDVTQRISEPNGIMANVATRMANEMACWTVAADFTREPSARMMFPFVEVGFEPLDLNGFEVAGASSAIRANIQYLHQRLLGEFVDLNDPEIDRTYDLYVEVWKEGRDKLGLPIEEGGYGQQLPGACAATMDYWTGEPLPEDQMIVDDETYTIRAWMAVISYLLADYRFLHE